VIATATGAPMPARAMRVSMIRIWKESLPARVREERSRQLRVVRENRWRWSGMATDRTFL
jgi:hypothetical protein